MNGAAGDAGRASPTLLANGNPASNADADNAAGAGGNADAAAGAGQAGKRGASAMGEDGAAGGGAGTGGSSGGEGSSKRARKAQKKGAQEINQANVVATLKRSGGRLASKVCAGWLLFVLERVGCRYICEGSVHCNM